MATELNSETPLVNVLKSDAGVSLLNEIKGHYQDDLIFKSVLDKPKEFRNFEVKDDLIYLKLNRKSLLCIPKVIINGRNILTMFGGKIWSLTQNHTVKLV